MRCNLQGKSFKHVDSSMIPRGGSKAIYQSCGESLRSGDPTTIYCRGLHACIRAAVNPLGVYTAQ